MRMKHLTPPKLPDDFAKGIKAGSPCQRNLAGLWRYLRMSNF
jgi:hypothetical protein